jgi:large subunit ribosomal protein L3
MNEARAVGTKIGMTRVFVEGGRSVPVTVLQAHPLRVVARRQDADGRVFVTFAYGSDKPLAKMSKAVAGQYRAANVEGGEGLHTYQVPASSELKVADIISVTCFEEGQYIDVSGVSKGKGFQGGVKRHNFTMQPATHGTSLSHRALGSTGQCQDPGKVFKGKKMAGQMGNKRVTVQNLKVVRVDIEKHIILIEGAVPGAPGAIIEISPATKKTVTKEQGGES